MKTGILLMAHGGPNSLDDIEPFLVNIRGGRTPSPELIHEIKDRYRRIGGRSPLLEITRRQAKMLEEELGLPVRVGMRNWSPYIKDVVAGMAEEGIGRIVGMSLAPQYSKMSVGKYNDALRKAAAEIPGGQRLEVRTIDSWNDHPVFLEAIAEKVRAGLSLFEDPRGVAVVFTAHSLPESVIAEGDPYAKEMDETVQGVLARLPELSRWRFAYQSQGNIPGKWLGPEVESVLAELVRQETQNVLIAPVGFVSDHIEILYDIDIALKGYAAERGICLQRTESMNDSPGFIQALAAVVREYL